MININELDGNRIRKEIGFETVRKTYQNTHIDKSGNFGYFFRTQKKTLLQLDGHYNSEGNIKSLRFSQNWQTGFYVIFDTLKDLMEFLREETIKIDGEIKPLVQTRIMKTQEEQFDIIEIDGFKFKCEKITEDTVYNSNENSKTWKEIRYTYIEALRPSINKFREKGFKSIEIGSLWWFSHRHKTKGRFLTLSTMFLARLLKA